jgi:adenosyl cobinamide kinase/adenosyl cobinamide phosphate guanylyltransferase
MPVTVLVGGARSGKSDLAVRLAGATGRPVTVVATAGAGDAEMAERIAHHRRHRPVGWTTVEEELDLVGAVERTGAAGTVVVDCITLWVANAVGAGWDDAAVEAAAGRLAEVLGARPGPAVVVTNEVGGGIVPADPATRRFRDLHGRVNRILATAADEAVLVVAGRVLPLVPPAAHWTALDA